MILKYIVLLFFGAILLSCQAQKEAGSQKKLNKTIISNCPEDGNCSFEVLQNKSLSIKTDGIGAKYPQVRDGEQTVLKFEYKRDEDPSLADDGYTEVIYAEIDSATKALNLKDAELSQAKVLFGRLCFCRGQTGYYPVTKGQFEIKTNKDESVTYTFNLEITEVPQVLEEVVVKQ